MFVNIVHRFVAVLNTKATVDNVGTKSMVSWFRGTVSLSQPCGIRREPLLSVKLERAQFDAKEAGICLFSLLDFTLDGSRPKRKILFPWKEAFQVKANKNRDFTVFGDLTL